MREGIEQAGAADFGAALESFDAAEASEDLRRVDLVRLYGHRAVVRFALGDREAMEADLARLLAVAPEAGLPSAAPPPVHQAFARMKDLGVSAPRLTAQASPIPDGVEVRAESRGGPPGLVRQVRVFARVEGSERWSRGENRVAVLARAGVTVQWYARAIGPGGALVMAEGSPEDPRETRVGGEPTGQPETGLAPLTAAGPEDDDDGRRRRWWLIGTGATAVVSAAVVTAVLLAGGGGGGTTQVTGPTLVP